MKDSFLKRIEIRIRRFLIYLLKYFVHRNTLAAIKVDNETCKILFIRQDRIGDVLVSTPIFNSIKRKYPNATIDVLLSTNNYFVLDNEPVVNKRWIYRKSIIHIIRLIHGIRKEKYDYAVDLSDNYSVTASVLCLFSGAKVLVGLEKENYYIYDIRIPRLSRKETHIVDRLSQLLKAFDIDPAEEQLAIRYFTSNESDKKADDFIHSAGLSEKFIIGINISAGSDTRFWGIDNYIKLIELINSQHPYVCIVLLYKPSDLKRAEDICKSTKSVIAPVTETFDHYAAITKKINLLISPDTAVVHLASAFKIPSVILYVQSNKDLNIWSPYKSVNEVLITDVDDLSTIPVAKVVEAVNNIMNKINQL